MEIVENDLVMLRLNNGLSSQRQPHYNIWVRVLFIDTNNTFIGTIERMDRNFIVHKKGDTVKYPLDKVATVYDKNDGKQWCYKDDITRCDCSGLCRNS